MNEIWIEIERLFNRYKPLTIIAISNHGNMKRRNGIIEPIPLRQCIKIGTKKVYAYRILIEHFKPKTEEDIILGRDYVDHITHHPKDININDIRNLRWCTASENQNYEECRNNLSHACKGHKLSGEHKRKISETLNGRIPWNKGKKLK